MVLIDANVLAAQSVELTARLDELEKQAFAIAGEEFNLSSPKQLQTILFEKLNLPVVKKTRAVHRQPMRKCWKSWRITMNCRA